MYINFKAVNIILNSPIAENERYIIFYLIKKIINKEGSRIELLNTLNDELIDILREINKGLFITIDGESDYDKEIFTSFASATNSFNSRIWEANRDNRDRYTYNKNWVTVEFNDISFRLRYELGRHSTIISCLKKFIIKDIENRIDFCTKKGDLFNEITGLKNIKELLKCIPA